MDKLNNILNALEEVDTNTLFQSAVKKFDDDIIKLNHSQLEQGQKSNGESTPEHTFGSLSKKYVDEKVAKGLIDNSTLPNVNLKNTGSFYSGFKKLESNLTFDEIFKYGSYFARYGSDGVEIYYPGAEQNDISP